MQASSSKPTMQQPSRVKPVVSSAAQLRGLMMKVLYSMSLRIE